MFDFRLWWFFVLFCFLRRKHVKEPKEKHWNIKEISGLIKYMQPYVNIMHQYDLFHWSQMHINMWISAQSKWSSKWAKHKKWDGERRFWAFIGECQMKRHNWRPKHSDLKFVLIKRLSFIMWTHWNCQMYLHINGLHGLPWDRRAGRPDGKAENSSFLFYF